MGSSTKYSRLMTMSVVKRSVSHTLSEANAIASPVRHSKLMVTVAGVSHETVHSECDSKPEMNADTPPGLAGTKPPCLDDAARIPWSSARVILRW
jgi:hypothetical protein